MPSQLVTGPVTAGPTPNPAESATEVPTTSATTTFTSQQVILLEPLADSTGPDTDHTVGKTASVALPEARLVIGNPEEDLGFTRGQTRSMDPKPPKR